MAIDGYPNWRAEHHPASRCRVQKKLSRLPSRESAASARFFFACEARVQVDQTLLLFSIHREHGWVQAPKPLSDVSPEERCRKVQEPRASEGPAGDRSPLLARLGLHYRFITH